MSAEETKHDLPPGQSLKPVINGLGVPLFWRIIDSRGVAIGARDSEYDARAAAWLMFGITRDEYKAMQRDRRAMNLLRASKDKPWRGILCTPEDDGRWCASAAIGEENAPGEDDAWNQVHDDPAEAIIAALGESS